MDILTGDDAHDSLPGAAALVMRVRNSPAVQLPYAPADAGHVPGVGIHARSQPSLTVPCPHCTLATHRHCTLDFDGVNTYRSQAGTNLGKPTRSYSAHRMSTT
ncbi:hypothetical protein ACFWWT_46220 [Streptomyces sp. NPDC058676]|uniref:hypothetical protein n=1 Tax=unclassified Streptomyces TaxID=2593676 RepID=UPI00366518F6